MNAIIAAVLLASCANDFEWKFSNPEFQWAAAQQEPVNVRDFVHVIDVYHGQQADVGSAVHVGNGRYLASWHVFTDDAGRPWNVTQVRIDDRPVTAKWTPVSGRDAVIVETDATSAPAAVTNCGPLDAGQPLTVCGRKTGSHRGTLGKEYLGGTRVVVCPEPNTENGDSGAGVFNDAGELVGVHWGSKGEEVFFTPLSVVAELSGKSQPEAGAGSAGLASEHAGPASFPSPGVLKFEAPWCPHCRSEKVSPWLKKSNWKVTPVVADRNNDGAIDRWAEEIYGVTALPAFVVILNGKAAGTYQGTDPNGLLPLLKQVQASAAVDSATGEPSSWSAIAQALEAAGLKAGETMADLGCGDGRALVVAVEQFGAARATGVEIDHQRAQEARRLALATGTADRIAIVEGDVLKANVKADVAYVYQFPDVLESFRPTLTQNFDRVVSYAHQVPGLPMQKRGDVYLWERSYGMTQPVQAAPRMAVWNGQYYTGPQCNRPGCSMCASIRRQLGL